MGRLTSLAFLFVAASPALAQSAEFTLQGRVTTERSANSIRVILEDPRAGNTAIASVEPSDDGEFEIAGLQKRNYRLVTLIDGKRQERRDVDILCRPGSVVSKDFHYGRAPSTLMLAFPAEDPDFIDVAELQGNYSKDVLRDYEKAFQDHINGNPSRAIERLEAIVTRAPEFYGAHARLGVVYQQVGCFFDAEAEYKQASSLSARSVQPLLNLASVQIRAADLPGQRDNMVNRALETLKKALELRPGSALSYCLLGAAQVKIQSFTEAEKNLQRALDLDSDLAAARLLLANLYLKQKNWEAASQNLRTYLDDFPFARDRDVVKQMMENAQRSARNSDR